MFINDINNAYGCNQEDKGGLSFPKNWSGIDNVKIYTVSKIS